MPTRFHTAKVIRNSIGLDVAQAATRLATEIYRLMRSFPKGHVPAWSDEARRTADALSTVIARIQGDLTHTQFTHCMMIAGVLIAELEGYLMMAEQSGHLPLEQLDAVTPVVGFIRRFCSVGLGLEETRTVKRQLVS